MSYAKLGFTPDGGATWSLGRSLPRPFAQRLLWLAEPVTASTLHGQGLVTAVTPPGSALSEALSLCDRLAAMAPNAIACTKELLEQAPRRTLHEQLGVERDQFLDKLFHANGEEGLAAFLEKRPPRFR
jgi:enoyl-CoA hydratase/carnithine racemase